MLPCLPSVWVCGQDIPITPKNTTEVPIEFAILIACIIDHVHINVGEIIADQFKRRDKKQDTSFPYPSLMSQFQATAAATTIPPELLKLEQMTQVHESQLMKLPKAIPSMIQQVITKAMQPTRDKLKGLCTTVEVL
ncbi:hypothetical protein HAX54_018631 [Datura stramonium]|uniref:Uncharacterized protein n=1 Tax=Datura stramonium TaxID=4076 RepID=A0ABS8UQ34_DATST|nr:hypothetical protein [Datura stramonium]